MTAIFVFQGKLGWTLAHLRNILWFFTRTLLISEQKMKKKMKIMNIKQ